MKSDLFLPLASSGLSPEESKRLTAHAGTADARDRNPPAEQPKCVAVPEAPPKEEMTPPAEPKAQAVLVPAPAVTKGGEEKREDLQPITPKPAESFGSLTSRAAKLSDQKLSRPLKGAEESMQEKPQTATSLKPAEERQLAASTEPAVKEATSTSALTPRKPKSPGASETGTGVASEVTAQETPEKEPPATEQMEVNVESLKRKPESPEEAPISPEKKPRIVENCQAQHPFRIRMQPFPATGERSQEQRVPPLRVKTTKEKSAVWLYRQILLVTFTKMFCIHFDLYCPCYMCAYIKCLIWECQNLDFWPRECAGPPSRLGI